jgi:hypothetical protein
MATSYAVHRGSWRTSPAVYVIPAAWNLVEAGVVPPKGPEPAVLAA